MTPSIAATPTVTLRRPPEAGPAGSHADPDEFGDLYDAYFPRVYRYFLTVLRNRQEAEDAAHEVFVKVLRALSRVSLAGTQTEHWLFRIARNHAIDIRRRPDRMASVSADAGELAGETGSASSWEERPTSLRASEGKILALIAELPLSQRQVLVLRYLYELDTEQIAQAMGRTSGHVRVLEHRALNALRSREASGEYDIRSALGSRRRTRPVGRHRLHDFTLQRPRSAMWRLPFTRARASG
jgi:RNA polymerase sigma-70 factor (ECF subfamily)